MGSSGDSHRSGDGAGCISGAASAQPDAVPTDPIGPARAAIAPPRIGADFDRLDLADPRRPRSPSSPAARAVTQLYDAALRPTGLRITQFTLLRALARAGGPMTQDALGELLAVDSTTLSRTLRQLEQSKWIRRVDRTRGSAASTSPLRGGAFSSARRPRGNACSGGSARTGHARLGGAGGGVGRRR